MDSMMNGDRSQNDDWSPEDNQQVNKHKLTWWYKYIQTALFLMHDDPFKKFKIPVNKLSKPEKSYSIRSELVLSHTKNDYYRYIYHRYCSTFVIYYSIKSCIMAWLYLAPLDQDQQLGFMRIFDSYQIESR